MVTEDAEITRKKAQRLLLVEHVFNTLADRMWLYAAGLLLMNAVMKVDKNISPIAVSSAYGLILSLIKVIFVGWVGGLIERLPRLKGAITALVIQNTSVAISCIILAVVFAIEKVSLPAWALFTIVTFFSGIAMLASVALMNVVGRDWAVEISSAEELTTLNSWLRAIDQVSLILAAGLSGIMISVDYFIGGVVIGVINIVAMAFQSFLMLKIYKMMPGLSDKEIDDVSQTDSATIWKKTQMFFESWVLFFKSDVFLPGFALGVLYLNILGMGFPLQGFGRQSCLTEATISIIYIFGAVTGFVAPVMYPHLVRMIGFVKTGVSAGLWQIFGISLSIIALFVKGSEYNAFKDEPCPLENVIIDDTPTDSFWISCPKDENGDDIYARPQSYLSVGLIFTSSILQRWGVYLFDMVVTQLFQVTVSADKRNRVAAGQFSLNSVFSIAMYFFGLIWTENCNFGSAILLGSSIMIISYISYFIWAATKGKHISQPIEDEGSEENTEHTKKNVTEL